MKYHQGILTMYKFYCTYWVVWILFFSQYRKTVPDFSLRAICQHYFCIIQYPTTQFHLPYILMRNLKTYVNSFTVEIEARGQCTGWCNLIGTTMFNEHSAWANVARDCWGFSEFLYVKDLQIMKIKGVEWSTSNFCHRLRLQIMQDIFYYNSVDSKNFSL